MIVDPDTPQSKPLTGVPGIKTSDQIVSEIHGAMANLPPEHQAALDHGMSMMKSPESGKPDPGGSISPERVGGMSGDSAISAPPEKVGGIARSEGAGASDSPVSGIPGMVGVSSGNLVQPPDAASSDAMPLPVGRSIPGRTAALESPRMLHPGVGSYEPLPHPASPAATELNRLRDSGAGWHGIHNPFLKTLAGIGDVVGSGFFPQFAQFIPGTSAHHEQLIEGKEAQVGDEQKRLRSDEEAQKAADESVVSAANARHLNAEADTSTNKPPATITTDKGIMQWNPATHAYDVMAGTPAPKEEVEGKTVTTSRGIMQWNPKTHAYDIKVGDAEAKDQQNVHVLPDGSVVAVHHDPKTGKSTAEVVYKGDPKTETEVTKLEVNGKPHTVLVNKKTGETIKDLGETGEKPPNVNINQGTWSIQEDANGKPIEYNSKTGETRAVAAGGVQKAGTKEKHDAAEEKRIGPGRDALKYADDYMKTGAFTGPGDVALQEKFFELAKPSSGFRMTKEQMKKIQDSASWMGSIEGKGYHALHGTWFSPTQRQEIVTTMKSLQGTHEPAGGGGKTEEWDRDANGRLVKK